MATGRPPLSSESERALVYVLADADWSSRRIAASVFGDATKKDRVLRLLARRRQKQRRARELNDEQADALIARHLADKRG